MVSVSSTTSEIDVATRITISPALCRPWLVSPTRCPNHDPSGTTMWPWVTKLKVAGRTTTPVKIGMNSHTRLTKNPTGRREAAASPRVARYMATSTGMLRTTAAVLRTRAGLGRRPTWPAARRSSTRLTVLAVVPHNTAAPRYEPTSSYALTISISSLRHFMWASLPGRPAVA